MVSTDARLLKQLTRSQIFRDYEEAFSQATELPLTLRLPDEWKLPLSGHRHENPFCALLAHSNKGCAACLEMQEKLNDASAAGSQSATCFAGLCDTAVPVRVGEKIVGILQTGQVALEQPSAAQFARITAQLIQWGATVDLRRLEDAYFHSRTLTPEQYAGMVRLLEIFASHLGLVANQLLIQDSTTESPLARRTKSYVADHLAQPISLEEVAAAMHVSTFYFCKMFKKATGLTFTDYLGRVRVERAKTLLLDPDRRVTEVAFAVGFGSLTHFNRVFRQVVGQSPTDYRKDVSPASPPPSK